MLALGMNSPKSHRQTKQDILSHLFVPYLHNIIPRYCSFYFVFACFTITVELWIFFLSTFKILFHGHLVLLILKSLLLF